MKAYENELASLTKQDQFFENMSQKGPSGAVNTGNRRKTDNVIQLDRYISDGHEMNKKKKKNCKC